MASKYWIKVYHEILDDPKMGRMPDRLWRRTIELFLIAGEQDTEGELPKLGDMAYRLRLSDDELQNDLEQLQELNIVHIDDGIWIVTKFAERQAPVSDAERMRRYRERQRKEEYYGDDDDTDTVTDTVTKRSQIRIDKIREDKKRIELFCNITKNELPKSGSIYADWIKEIDNWANSDIVVGDIELAYDLAVKKGYEIKRPSGLSSFVFGIQKERLDKEASRRVFTGPNGEEIKI